MTILIKNGLVYDGSERIPEKKDILVRGEKIVGLGTFSKSQTDKIIDAVGAIVTPGIVDINTDSDRFLSIFSEPYQIDFIKQGITTIIGGNCGFSLAPFFDSSLFDLIADWSNTSKININWYSMAEFLNAVEKRKIGVNFGTLVGYSTIRQAFIKTTETRDLTETELDAFKKILIQSLKEGAFGLSISLAHFPYRRWPFWEIKELAKTVALTKGVYSVHLRDVEAGVGDSIAEIIDVARETNVNLEINHFQPLKNFVESYRQALKIIEKEGVQLLINFDCYPFDTTARPIFTFLPSWIQNNSLEVMLDYLISPHLESKILEYFRRFYFSDLTIGFTPSPFQRLCGKTLEEFADSINTSPPQALLRLMRMTRLKCIIFDRNIDENLLDEFMISPLSIISSNGVALPEGEFKHERNWKTFPKFLKWASNREEMSFEKAIAKITSKPALKYGIDKRGLIKEGYYADLVIWRDYQPTEVLLNGVIILEEGKPLNILAGKVLRRNI